MKGYKEAARYDSSLGAFKKTNKKKGWIMFQIRNTMLICYLNFGFIWAQKKKRNR